MTRHGVWSQVEIGRHAADVFEPAKPSEHGYTVLYLHGVHLGRLVDNEAFTAQFAARGLRAIAPMTGPVWWTDRVSPAFDPKLSAERHIFDNVLPFIAARWGIAPPRIALLGTSMGGQGCLRFAFKHPNRFPVAAAISPAIDYYTRIDEGDAVLAAMYADAEAARQDTALLQIHALNYPRNVWFCCDPADYRWHDSADRLRMKLYSLGIPHECDLETGGGGHGFDYYDRMAPAAMAFIAERLERERLRVV